MTIYFIEIENENAIKIGYTAGTVGRRLSQLQTGQPSKLHLIGTIPGERDAERGLHLEFASFRKNGEWFYGTPDLRVAINHLIKHQLAWYFCRETGLKKKRSLAMYDAAAKEWQEAFSKEPIIEIIEASSTSDIIAAYSKLRRFREAERRLKGKNSAAWRSGFYKTFQAFRETAQYKFTRYIEAWELSGAQ